MDRSYIVTLGARRITRLGGSLTRQDKAVANRRARRAINAELREKGEDASGNAKLYTDYDVI